MMIADDETVARLGVCAMLVGSGIEVVCQAENHEQILRYALSCDIDVALLDLRLDGTLSFSVIEEIKKQKPNLRVLVFSASDSLSDMTRARDAGADGYLSKTATRADLIKAIQKVAAGQSAWTREQRRRFKNLLKASSVEPVGIAMTPQELRVLARVAAGLTNEEIAAEFAIGVETVKQHLKHVLRKLGLKDRTQAALWAVRYGVASADPPPCAT